MIQYMFMFSLAIQICNYMYYVVCKNIQFPNIRENVVSVEIPLQVPSLMHFGGKRFFLQNLMNQAENLGIDIVPHYLFLHIALNCLIS